jgi:hypothetical protein
MTSSETGTTRLDDIADLLGLTMETVFVPYSQSRHQEEKWRSLNWKVSIYHQQGDRKSLVVAIDYSAGVGHCPSTGYSRKGDPQAERRLLEFECEHGIRGRYLVTTDMVIPYIYSSGKGRQRILPKLADVLSCLVTDADAINYSSFEDWASSFGYDTDSRKAEKIYQECLKIGLALRNSLSDDGLKRLQNAAQDY